MDDTDASIRELAVPTKADPPGVDSAENPADMPGSDFDVSRIHGSARSIIGWFGYGVELAPLV